MPQTSALCELDKFQLLQHANHVHCLFTVQPQAKHTKSYLTYAQTTMRRAAAGATWKGTSSTPRTAAWPGFLAKQVAHFVFEFAMATGVFCIRVFAAAVLGRGLRACVCVCACWLWLRAARVGVGVAVHGQELLWLVVCVAAVCCGDMCPSAVMRLCFVGCVRSRVACCMAHSTPAPRLKQTFSSLLLCVCVCVASMFLAVDVDVL